MINKAPNLIKVRDDREPFEFQKDSKNAGFTPCGAQAPEWCSESFTKNDLRSRIEPWLTSLFQSEHLSLLIGSGLTSAVQYSAAGNSNNGMNEEEEFSVFSDEIKLGAERSAMLSGRKTANIEDRIRVCNALISGLEIIKDSSRYPNALNDYNNLCSDLEKIMVQFTNNISAIERSIALANDQNRVDAFNKLVLFLMSFASRSGTRDRLNIFTTNYDRLIETGADIAGLRLIDRFVGALTPVFRASRLDVDMHYNPPGIRGEPRYLEGVVRFTKLHGSLDWVNLNGDIRRIGLPFGPTSLEPFLNVAGLNNKYSSLMIYPNAAKDRETSEYPYVELFRDYASALCRPNSTLVTYGYSFGDEHVNRVMRDMLTIPSTHLVILAFDDSTGRIMDNYASWGHQSQISLIIGKDVANLNDLVDYYLPKPSIDRASIRMAEILHQRFATEQESSKERDGKERDIL